jgi:septal ring factor EnvC (AmiA/AmiB activator)
MADVTSPVTGPHSGPHDRHDIHAASPFAVRATVFVLAVLALVLAYVTYQEKSRLADTRAQLNEATANATQANADLDRTKTQAAGLQSQLDQAGARQSNLEAQLATAQSQRSDFQSQVARAQAAQADLQAQLDKARSQAAGLQSELSRANDGAADAHRQLDQANARAADLQSQLDKAKSDAAAAPAAPAAVRALPVAATFEKGFWGGKYTLHLKNEGSDPLSVNVTVDGGAVKSATIQASSTYDVGGLAAGSNVVVSGDGFESTTLTAK